MRVKQKLQKYNRKDSDEKISLRKEPLESFRGAQKERREMEAWLAAQTAASAAFGAYKPQIVQPKSAASGRPRRKRRIGLPWV